jgi:hypothetical protein
MRPLTRFLNRLLGGRPLPSPHHTTVPRPWRYHATHWTAHHGRVVRS